MTTIWKSSKILSQLSPDAFCTLYSNYLKRHEKEYAEKRALFDGKNTLGYFEIWENAGGAALLQATEKGRFETVRLFLDSNSINIPFRETFFIQPNNLSSRNVKNTDTVIDNKMALEMLFTSQRNRIYRCIATANSKSDNEAKEIMLCLHLLKAEHDIQAAGLNSLELRKKLIDAFKKHLNEHEVKPGFEREVLRNLVVTLVPKGLLHRNPGLLAKLELRLVNSVISSVIPIRTCDVLNKSRNDRASFTDLMPLIFNYAEGTQSTTPSFLLSDAAQQIRVSNSIGSGLIPAGAAAASVTAVAEELRTRTNP